MHRAGETSRRLHRVDPGERAVQAIEVDSASQIRETAQRPAHLSGQPVGADEREENTEEEPPANHRSTLSLSRMSSEWSV